ncbi:TPA: cysteine desulfurase [Streptococcus suis]|uniref:cysteine desulfurase n=1 Tax=Streptococcus suivaginalis TaxID=3028082 RepID=A0AA96VPQ6_9STRE|nr:cysteine desulfurase family protein [Streptococcus sp. 29896]MCK4027615.1 cysteine desulfurase [Streptococcus suis]WNY46245.1 cysteine desulfurase family protein [Streptococcus sp. 29896]HEL1586507.1 cysteine desulfurase [Streptococcus suis]
MIYFDHAATTPMSSAALKTYLSIAQTVYGNPSSIHSAGRLAHKELRQARQTIATAIGVHADQIIFTSGGSEANNLAIKGYALANQSKGKHLITTAIEHHSVLETMDYLATQHGFEVTYLQPVDGNISAQQVKEALRADTILVSIMYVNNETGMILPIEEIATVLADHPARFHVDAVQAIGKLPIQLTNLAVDFLSASAHKFHGPRGVGFLFAADMHFHALIHGGKQEGQRRAGTENLAGIAAMATALTQQLENMESNTKLVQDLKDYLLEQLSSLPHYLNLPKNHLPYVLNVGLPDTLNEQVLMRLDLAGIALSSGSACTSGVIQTSHVLEALYGKKSHRLKESLRISLAESNTKEEIDQLIHQLSLILGV